MKEQYPGQLAERESKKTTIHPGAFVMIHGGNPNVLAVVRNLSACGGAVRLVSPLHGYYQWNIDDVEPATGPAKPCAGKCCARQRAAAAMVS